MPRELEQHRKNGPRRGYGPSREDVDISSVRETLYRHRSSGVRDAEAQTGQPESDTEYEYQNIGGGDHTPPSRFERGASHQRFGRDGGVYESEGTARRKQPRTVRRDAPAADARTSRDMDCAEYVENGASGITLERPAFTRMNEDIRMKHIQAVLIQDVSRISRNYFDFHAWRNDMRERGVHVHSLVDGRIL